LGIHRALDVLIQELVAGIHAPVVDPMVGLILAEIRRPIVVELHLLGGGGYGETHECCQNDVFHIVFLPLNATAQVSLNRETPGVIDPLRESLS
jgi:hypothetical protein